MQNQISSVKKQSLYGFHVEGLNLESKQTIRRILKRYRPSVTSYSNDYEGALSLYDITEGETNIIHRTYQPGNIESSWNNWSTANWKEFFSRKSPSPIIQAFLNNPTVSNTKSEINEYTDFVIDVLAWATDHHYKLAFSLPINIMSWDALMVEGYYDRLLLAYDNYGFREHGHIATIKEQSPYHINLASALNRTRNNYSLFNAETLLFPELMAKEYWPTREEVNTTHWESNKYLFKSVWINKRLEALDRQPIPVVVSEFNWGSNNEFDIWEDKLGQSRNIQNEIPTVYSINSDPYPRFSGIMSLKNLYSTIFKDINNPTLEDNWFEKRIYDQIVYLQDVAPDNYLGFCWYTLDPGSTFKDTNAALSYQTLLENIEPLLYDTVLNQPEVELKIIDSAVDISNTDEKSETKITLKIDDQKENTGNALYAPQELSISEWKAYWVSSTGLRSNIRSRADVKSETVGKIEPEESIYYVAKQMIEVDTLGYRWMPIADFNGTKIEDIFIKGWIREDAVNLRKYEFLHNLPVKIIVTINNATTQEVEWVKRKINNGDIKVDIKVD